MNNSWAMNGAAYTADDRTVDLGVRDADPAATDQTPLVIVFSAGNSGPGAGTVTKNPKNAILVGNSLNCRPGELTANDDIRGLATSSSRGPAADGRMLPTVVAPGTDIISTYSPVGFRSGPTPTRAARCTRSRADVGARRWRRRTSRAMPRC